LIDLIFASTDPTTIVNTIGVVVGVLAAIAVPFILNSLSKRAKDWEKLKDAQQKTENTIVLVQAEIGSLKEKLESLSRRCGDAADRASIDQLRAQIDGLKDNGRDMFKEFVTIQQYRRDIDAFDHIVQLLRDTIQQQTDMLERLRKQ